MLIDTLNVLLAVMCPTEDHVLVCKGCGGGWVGVGMCEEDIIPSVHETKPPCCTTCLYLRNTQHRLQVERSCSVFVWLCQAFLFCCASSAETVFCCVLCPGHCGEYCCKDGLVH